MCRHLIAAAILSLAVLAFGCGGDDPPEAADNLFGNGGFEEGGDPWFSLKPPDFTVSQEQTHGGSASALLQMRAGAGDEDAKVFYLVQEVDPDEFPELISGYYRVDHWARGTQKQYLQFVVIAFGVDNLATPYVNHQIRYILAGIEDEPFSIANARFVFLSREEPTLGEWVRFERNLREDFQQLWGAVPEGYEKIRVLFEVRYDDKALNETAVEADVYYDDLYMGPAP